ncbi:MAG: tRNA 4-thiouridine(8) synthase ThiI, partial [Lentisphaeraceae bacterium]|nr:tRNA 4-thiouridine(8) synthase ThiI [Lentisphaeraceae bacterium]
SNWDIIKETVLKHIPLVHAAHTEGRKEGELIPYRTRARRSFKKFPFTSNEIEIEMAEILLSRYENLKINLSAPEMFVGIEIRDNCTFVFFENIRSLGGLPVGSNDPFLALMSGGIDSPVACIKTMQRGSHVDFLTFHSHPYTSKDGLGKIAKLINIVNEYQDKPGRFYACNLVEAQKMIRDRCMPKLRTVLYRRMMMRIAQVFSRYLRTEALVTGESLGQVASQTVKNMDCINRATDLLISRPLIAYDKNETIELARKFGTLETSNIPAADSCTTFAPKKPATNANMHLVEKSEARLDMDDVIRACLKDSVFIDTITLEEREAPKLLDIFERQFVGHWDVEAPTEK